MCFNQLSQIKQKCLSISLEDYLKINAFLASGGGVNKEVLSSMNGSYWKLEVECQKKSLL